MKRFLLTLCATALVPFFAWIGGYDFDSRGDAAFFTATYSLLVGIFTYLSVSNSNF